MSEDRLANMKLFMVLLGSKAPARNVEQHDFFFGVANSLASLVPQLRRFWPEAGKSLHIDGWGEVTAVDGYRVEIQDNKAAELVNSEPKLFFINLGGYTAGQLEEQHYTLLSVCGSKAQAIQQAKRAAFFKEKTVKGIKGANAHIDEKYGIDVDDVHQIEDIWRMEEKQNYSIKLVPDATIRPDEIHLGYLRLEKLLVNKDINS